MITDDGGDKAMRRAILPQLPERNWPANDRALWSKANAPVTDPFEDDRPAAKHAESTRVGRWRTWSEYLAFLAARGWLLPDEATEARLTRARALHLIQHMHTGLRSSTIRQKVMELSLVAAALCPGHDWQWLRKLPGVPTPTEASSSRRADPAFDAARLVGAILRELHALQGSALDLASLLWARDLTIVVVAIHTALRPRNLHGCRLGETVIVGENEIRLHFRAGETKRGRPILTTLHEVPASALRFYLREVRPLLLAAAPPIPDLWLSQHGRAMGRHSLADSCVRVGLKLIGKRTNPNSTRHAFATRSREMNPTDLKSVAIGLTHSTPRTGLTYYDRSGDRPAEQVWKKVRKKAGHRI
jgi:integrase